MNPFFCKTYCDVCGGEGVGTPRTSAAMWSKEHTVRHTDPRVCADNLQRRKEELDQKEKELNSKVPS